MGRAFVAKLAAAGARDPEALAAWIGRKKHGTAGMAKKSAARARKSSAAKAAPERRDMKRGMDAHGDLAVSDSDIAILRSQADSHRTEADRFAAVGLSEAAERARKSLAEAEAKIADAEYGRETKHGEAEYEASVRDQRARVNEVIAKARRTHTPEDWEAARQAASSFAEAVNRSPYGGRDSGWFTSEAATAGREREEAAARQVTQERRRKERTLPAPQPGEAPVAYTSDLGDSDGTRVFGDGNRARAVMGRSQQMSAMPDTGAAGHDSALARVSPAFRRKVQAARASGQPWMHSVGTDSAGAEIHELQAVIDGRPQKITYLERNSAAWKRHEQQRRAAS